MRISGRPEEAGFTLIELLVVVAVIALLTAFALPRVIDALDESRHVVGQGDLHTIETALERYRLDDEHGGGYPALSEEKNGDWFRMALADYLRPNARLTNGYYDENLSAGSGHGYVYLSDAAGAFFILVDPGDNDTIKITCDGQEKSVTVGQSFQGQTAAPIKEQHVSVGCTAWPEGVALITN